MKVAAPEGWVVVETPCQEDPDLWFSDNEGVKEQAKNICVSCPLQSKCMATATENRERYGIWGGKDFSKVKLPNLDPTMCRKGLHRLPEERKNNQCPECREATQKAYHARQSRDQTPRYLRKLEKDRARGNKNASRHKNVIGGKCKSGHNLVEGAYNIRAYDGAIVCKKCLHKSKVSVVGVGTARDLNMGSRNHG
ncbi:MAG: WhiB family transcriptional regulator [Chitinophagaceae bacterium]